MTKRELINALEASKVNDNAKIKISSFFDDEEIILTESINLNIIQIYSERPEQEINDSGWDGRNDLSL